MPTLDLVHITDTHIGQPGADAQLAAVVAHLQAGPDLQAVLATGDLVDTPEDAIYQDLARLLRPLPAPVLALPGNHDDPERLRAIFSDSPVERPACWSQGDWSIVSVNTHVAGSSAGALGERRLAALEAALHDNQSPHLLVAMHHPPVPIGSPWMDAMACADGAALLQRLAADGRTRVVLWGHVHQAFASRVSGMALYATPSTYVQFAPRSDRYAIADRRPGYRWLRLQADGSHATGVVYLPERD